MMHAMAVPTEATVTNPFTPSFGSSPMSLVGRDDLLASVDRALEAGPPDYEFTRLLLGGRGTGKTALLAVIRDRAAERGMVALEAEAGRRDLEHRIRTLIAQAKARQETVWEPVSPPGRKRVSGVGVGPLSIHLDWERLPEPSASWDLRGLLEELARWAQSQSSGLILTLDEMHAAERGEIRDLATDLQSITNINRLPLAFVGAGLPEMQRTLLSDKRMTFFHRCHRDHMPPLGYADAWNCLRSTIDAAYGEVAPAALQILAESAGSTPYGVQIVGYRAWQLAGAPQRVIDERVAEEAARLAAADMLEKVAKPAWSDLGEADQDYLYTVAMVGGEASPQSVSVAMGWDPKTSRRAMNRLIDAEHLERTDSGTVRLVGPMTAAAVQSITGPRASAHETSSRPGFDQASGATLICNEWMPRAKARCVLAAGHRGYHRSRRL